MSIEEEAQEAFEEFYAERSDVSPRIYAEKVFVAAYIAGASR